jgi:hypothetical protein
MPGWSEPDDLAWADDPVDDQLLAWAQALDREALGAFADALGRRRDDLVFQGQNVAMPMPPQPPSPGVGGAAAVPAAAPPPPVTVAVVAECLRGLVIETGDDIATVAAAVGVEADWARGILTGSVTEVDPAHIARMCQALATTPQELLGVDAPAPAIASGPERHRTRPAPGPEATATRGEGSSPALGELVRRLPELDRPALVGLAAALGRHHTELSRRSRSAPAPGPAAPGDNLPSPSPGVGGQQAETPTFPAAPAAAQLAIFMIDTGDDVETVARGLGVDPAWVHGVMTGEITHVDSTRARQLCRGLDLRPTEVFGPPAAPLEAEATTAHAVPGDVGGAQSIVAAMRHELADEADHRGLRGRRRDDWIESELDELTDPCVPLPSSIRPVVGLAAQYRAAAFAAAPALSSVDDVGPATGPGDREPSSPPDAPPATPELGLGP